MGYRAGPITRGAQEARRHRVVEGFVNLNFTRVSDSLRVGLVLASRFLRICVPLKKGAVFFAPTVAGRAGHVVGARGTNLDANRYQEMRSLAPAYRWAIRIVIVVLVIEAAFVMVILTRSANT